MIQVCQRVVISGVSQFLFDSFPLSCHSCLHCKELYASMTSLVRCHMAAFDGAHWDGVGLSLASPDICEV